MRSHAVMIRSNIRQKMKDKKIKVETLCSKLGRTRYYFSRISEGTPIKVIIEIAFILDCEPWELLKNI